MCPNGTILQNGCGKLNYYTSDVLKYFKEQGATHLWFTGLLAHASQTDYSEYGIPSSHGSTVKGIAGSPYAVRDYYDIDPDLAVSVPRRLYEFKSLVNRVHGEGMKFIMDFVPNHVAREYESVKAPKGVVGLGEKDDIAVGFSPRNNFYYMPGQTLGGQHEWGDYREYPARATGNDMFTASPAEHDWYETVKLNYGVEYKADGSREKHFSPIPSTWDKMSDILLYWASKGVDAFRCDMSEMVPSEFWHYGIGRVKEQHPDILFIAEIYNPKVYEEYIVTGGFDYLYDKVELYDSIRSVVEGRRPIDAIESCLTLPTYTNDKVAGHMLNFLENHDEQRIASEFFGKNPQAGIPALYVSALINGNPYMQYFSQELGENAPDEEGYQGADGRTTIFDYWGLERQKAWKQCGWDETKLPTEYKAIRARYEQVLKLAQHPAVISGKTVNLTDETLRAAKVFAFQRVIEGGESLTVVANFGDEPFCGRVNNADVEVPAHDAITF